MVGLTHNYLILSLMLTFLYCFYVKVFKFLKQKEREEGLRSHKVKDGTITMGGILFVLIPLFFIKYDMDVLIIILGVLSFMVIGLLDDILIVLLKKNDGLSPTIKLVIEVIISCIIFYFYLENNNTLLLNVDLKWLFGLIILFLLIATTNAWNLLDGLDGLCAGLSIIIGFGLMYIAYKKSEFLILNLLIVFEIAIFIFWCFNVPKAFLFMGDTGSLSLGALYCLVSIYLNAIIPFIIMSGLYIFDTLSVIIQVFYYKISGGKRIFKMAPFHHHLELSGYNELSIDLIFYIVQIGLTILGVVVYCRT